MLAARQNDGRGGPFTFVIGTEPGEWRPSPPFFLFDPTPWVGNVTQFLVPNAERLRTDGPNPLESHAYTVDYNEVNTLGDLHSTTRTAEQTMAAIFSHSQPGGLYGGLMRSLSARFGLTTAQNAPVRHGEPGRGRRRDRLLERQVLLELLATDRRDSERRCRREPRNRRRPELVA